MFQTAMQDVERVPDSHADCVKRVPDTPAASVHFIVVPVSIRSLGKKAIMVSGLRLWAVT